MMLNQPFVAGLGMTLQKPTVLNEPPVNDQGYSLNELTPSDPTYKEVLIDFNNAGLKVCKIEQLHNHQLWQKYKFERKNIEDRKPQDDAFKLNEKYLYHGTTALKDYICTEGLDARLSKNGRFGRGIYFSDSPNKCVKYAEKGKEHFIFLARVILGCSKVYADGKSDKCLVREPEKVGKFQGWRFYDSVIGCPKDFKEFIIYRNDRALIDLVITFIMDGDIAAGAVPTFKPSLSFQRSLNSAQARSQNCLLKKPNFVNNSQFAHDDDDDSTDEEGFVIAKGGHSSDSSQDDGEKQYRVSHNMKHDNQRFKSNYFSSDSSDDDNIVNNKPQDVKAVYDSVFKPIFKPKTGEDILAEKRKAFTLATGERRHHVIESFLSTADLDVDYAVQLFHDKDKKRKEMEQQRLQEKRKQPEPKRDVKKAEEKPSDVPLMYSPRWQNASEEDREAIIQALVDDFMSIVYLDENAENRSLSRQVLFSCSYDIDLAIVSYYESM